MTSEAVDLNQFIIALLEAAYRSLKQATEGLTDEQLYYQPTAETNSIAWLVWHLSRWRGVLQRCKYALAQRANAPSEPCSQLRLSTLGQLW